MEKFIDYLKYEKRFSQHTIAAYTRDMDQFGAFLSTEFEVKPAQALHTFIRTWIVQLMEKGITARSVNRKISTLRTYYKFLMKSGEREDNPMVKIVAPKAGKRLPVFVEERGMDQLLSDIEFPSGFEGARDKLILDLFYQTGMRLTELINLREADFATDRVKVLGKRNKERVIPVNSEISSQVSDYLKIKGEEGPEQSGESAGYLFATNRGKKLYPKFVYRLVNNYLSKVTSLSKRSPHVLRHTFATHMLNNGADLNAIKEILGHANLSATQVYTHNSIDKLKQVHGKAHPRGA